MGVVMNFPMIRNYFADLFHRLSGVFTVSLVDGKGAAATADDPATAPGVCQFVLVAHGAGGQWDVYAGDFEHPLASFDQRQAGCDYASGLAKASRASIVLIQESPHSAATSG